MMDLLPIVVGLALVASWAALARLGLELRRTAKQRRYADRFDVHELARRLGLDAQALRDFEPRYSTQRVAKSPYRSAPARTLSVPDPDTKAIQRRVARRLLRALRVHEAATAWERGSSPARNAALHQRKRVVIKLDVVDFFGSTREATVEAYFRRIGWTVEAARILTRLTTHEGSLPQGAPTSPLLANRLFFPIDRAIAIAVARRRGTYTRYGDDLTISFPKDYPRRIRGIIEVARRALAKRGYVMHTKRKLRILRAHHSQLVTGCVINEGARLPRRTRRWLRAVEHRLRTGKKPATLRADQLRGWRGWEASIERARDEAK